MLKRRSESLVTRQRNSLGTIGEQAAAEYLQAQGFQILTRNWRCRIGEIDIVATEGRELVFVEVKTRIYEREAARYLFETITERKKNKLEQLVSLFIARHYCHLTRYPGAARVGNSRKLPPYRIDLVGVLLRTSNVNATAGASGVTIEHLRAAL